MVDEKQDSRFRPGIMPTRTPLSFALFWPKLAKIFPEKAEQITPSRGRIQQQLFGGEFRENLG